MARQAGLMTGPLSTPRPMATDPATYQEDGGVAVIALDDGKANAIGSATLEAIGSALTRAESDGAAVVVAGRPGRFSAGYDLSVMQAGPAAALELMEAGEELLMRLLTFPRPVIAACTGHAVAAGAAILLVCDWRVGADGPFKIGFNEVAIGLPLPAFVAELARDRLDRRQVVAATLGAHLYEPKEALEAGWFDTVLEPDAVVPAAIDEARRLAALPEVAFRLTKRADRAQLVARLRATVEDDIAMVASVLGVSR